MDKNREAKLKMSTTVLVIYASNKFHCKNGMLNFFVLIDYDSLGSNFFPKKKPLFQSTFQASMKLAHAGTYHQWSNRIKFWRKIGKSAFFNIFKNFLKPAIDPLTSKTYKAIDKK